MNKRGKHQTKWNRSVTKDKCYLDKAFKWTKFTEGKYRTGVWITCENYVVRWVSKYRFSIGNTDDNTNSSEHSKWLNWTFLNYITLTIKMYSLRKFWKHFCCKAVFSLYILPCKCGSHPHQRNRWRQWQEDSFDPSTETMRLWCPVPNMRV